MTTVGWVWTPGYVYHPGNVVWVRSGGYVGWIPCSPRGWSHWHRGSHAAWTAGYADGWRDARYATWVPWSKIGTDNVAHHAVVHSVATRGVSRSGVVATAVAPTRVEVERRTGRTVPQARVVERRATIDGRAVKVVRPEGQTDHVRRHGADTVKRALAPAARERTNTALAPAQARVLERRPVRTESGTRSAPPPRSARKSRAPAPTGRVRGGPVRRTPINPAAQRREPYSKSQSAVVDRFSPRTVESGRTERPSRAPRTNDTMVQHQRSTVESSPSRRVARPAKRPAAVHRSRAAGASRPSAAALSKRSGDRPSGSVRSRSAEASARTSSGRFDRLSRTAEPTRHPGRN
jgi:hypothetical protein